MHFIYNKKYITTDENNKIILTDEEHELNLEQKLIFNTYKHFIEKLKFLESLKTPKKILVIRDTENTGFLILSVIKNSYDPICYYSPECKEIVERLNKLFGIKKGSSSKYILLTTPSYTLIYSYTIFNIFITYDLLNFKGEPTYSSFKKKCKNGKIRNIIAPNPEIKDALRELNEILQYVYDKRNSNFQVAYKKEKNILTNANIHRNNKHVFNIDISDFFPSCKRENVKKYLKFLFVNSIDESILEDFLDIILINDALFIGSPISGTLANAILSHSASFIHNICKKMNISFSIYADDFSFSSSSFISEELVYNIFNRAMDEYGLETFKINEKKSIGFSSHRRKITGVSINNKNQLTIPNNYFSELRVKIEKLAHSKEKQNIQKLRGKIAYALMVDEGGKVFRYLKKFEDTIKENNLVSEPRFKELEEKFK